MCESGSVEDEMANHWLQQYVVNLLPLYYSICYPPALPVMLLVRFAVGQSGLGGGSQPMFD